MHDCNEYETSAILLHRISKLPRFEIRGGNHVWGCRQRPVYEQSFTIG